MFLKTFRGYTLLAVVCVWFVSACSPIPPVVDAPTAAVPAADQEVAPPAATGTAGIPAEATADDSADATVDATVEPPSESPADAEADTEAAYVMQRYAVPPGAHPHDVAPDSASEIVWYTAQHQEALGLLDPDTGETRHIHLGDGSSPHGVIVGPDGAPWITDGGLNAIVRVDPQTEEVEVFPLPDSSPRANLNTAVFDSKGILWFTGQAGIYGRLDPQVGEVEVFEAPRGRGPYGITATPQGDVYYASLAGNHIAAIDTTTGEATVIEPPTPLQGARRVWSDSQGRVWVSEWNSGQLSVYDPATGEWELWKLPGDTPFVYAVYVDEQDQVWVSEWSAQVMARFNPETEEFQFFPLDSAQANVRQIHGRPGEVWAAESGIDQLVVLRR